MNRFNDRYRIPSVRAVWSDYGANASYFITICTKNRAHLFGSIRQGEMALSDIGRIVEEEWLKTPALRADMDLRLGLYVVMPNHFHGILTIGKNETNQLPLTEIDPVNEIVPLTNMVETHCNASLQTPSPPEIPFETKSSSAPGFPSDGPKNRFGPQSKNLPSIVRGFKGAVTTRARLIDPRFAWQSRYHDHIIRDMFDYQRIAVYIACNPSEWESDPFHHQTP